jgi:hypothetical protein
MTTDNKTLGIDVLAEMEQAHATLKGMAYASELTGDHIQADAMLEARAAVTELIDTVDELIKHTSGCEALLRVAQTETLSNAKSALARVKGESA